MPKNTPKHDDTNSTEDREAAQPAGRIETVLAGARDVANGALDETRRAARRAGEAAEANPLAVVAGGIALGVVAGALLPKTDRETELLRPVGRRLTEAASDAANAAKEAAKVELSTLPLSKEAARAQVGKVLDQVAKAVSDAGEAALSSRKRPESQPEPAGAGAGEGQAQ